MTLRLFYSFVINENKEILLDVLCYSNKKILKEIDHTNTMYDMLESLYTTYSVWETKDVNSRQGRNVRFLLDVFAGYYYHGYET